MSEPSVRQSKFMGRFSRQSIVWNRFDTLERMKRGNISSQYKRDSPTTPKFRCPRGFQKIKDGTLFTSQFSCVRGRGLVSSPRARCRTPALCRVAPLGVYHDQKRNALQTVGPVGQFDEQVDEVVPPPQLVEGDHPEIVEQHKGPVGESLDLPKQLEGGVESDPPQQPPCQTGLYLLCVHSSHFPSDVSLSWYLLTFNRVRRPCFRHEGIPFPVFDLNRCCFISKTESYT